MHILFILSLQSVWQIVWLYKLTANRTIYSLSASKQRQTGTEGLSLSLALCFSLSYAISENLFASKPHPEYYYFSIFFPPDSTWVGVAIEERKEI